jgi:large subunit ribosomal protein L21
MYAIVENGSRQHRVEEGTTLLIDHKDGVEAGQSIEFDRVLLVESNGTAKIGQPLVPGAKVVAQVLGAASKKTVTQKFRRRKNSRRLRGHTQPYLRVKVTSIAG